MQKPIEEISLDGFQIVQMDMFTRNFSHCTITCSIWPERITFSNASLKALNNCEFIRLHVNMECRSILVVPVSSSDKDHLRWVSGERKTVTRTLFSSSFGKDLYKGWGLDPNYSYQATGRLVCSKNKVMLLYDFSQPKVRANKRTAT